MGVTVQLWGVNELGGDNVVIGGNCSVRLLTAVAAQIMKIRVQRFGGENGFHSVSACLNQFVVSTNAPTLKFVDGRQNRAMRT